MLYEALIEEIKRKAFIAKSMGQEFTDENYLEEIEKAMGRRAVMGEVRTWRGKEYIKTPKGWRPKPKGYKEGGEKKEGAGKEGKGESLVDMINRKLREGHNSVKDDMHEDAKRIAEGDKNEKREYASMDIKESKKFLVGKKITFKEYFSDGRGSYKDGVGEIERVRLYGKEKQPIAEIGFPNGDGITISLDQLDKREAMGYKIEFDDNQK